MISKQTAWMSVSLSIHPYFQNPHMESAWVLQGKQYTPGTGLYVCVRVCECVHAYVGVYTI